MIVEMRRDNDRQPDYLRCDECGKPVAEVRDGMIIIKVRHHGEWHISVFRLDDLLRDAA